MQASYLLLILTILSWVPSVPAQQSVNSDPVTVLKAGRMLDIKSGQVMENVTIVVRDGRIESVGHSTVVPQGADVIDLSQHTVMPGFIDMLTHLTGDPSYGYSDHQLHQWPGLAAIIGVKNARKTPRDD